MLPWHEEFPKAFESEKAEFEAIGFELDETVLKETARVVFRGELAWRDQRISLVVVYPQSFPELRVEVYADHLHLGRHQNPFRGNLCLLERNTRSWDQDWTGAQFVQQRVPYLLDLLDEGGDALREGEAPQGEPMSRFYEPERGAAIFIPEQMLDIPSTAMGGTLRLAIHPREEMGIVVRGCLSRVFERRPNGSEGDEVATVEEPLAARFSKTSILGSWVRLSHFPSSGSGTAEDLFAAAAVVPGFSEPPWRQVAGGQVKVLGVLANEEVGQGEEQSAWLFAVRVRAKQGARSYAIRGERLSVDDLQARIPTQKGLEKVTISLAGLGAVGAPLACELARSIPKEVRLLDFDEVEVGNTVRWPLGVGSVGHLKPLALGGTLGQEYPLTSFIAFPVAIGAAHPPEELPPGVPSESELLTQFLAASDLLIDATAELGVQQLLARLADEAEIPQVFVSMTEGGWGGIVARVIPGVTGCWLCLQYHLDTDGDIPPPPREPTGLVQPRGCAAPTFTGTSFAVLPIISQALKAVTSTLLSERRDDGQDVFICEQPLDDDDDLVAPSWRSYPLQVHPSCPYCVGA